MGLSWELGERERGESELGDCSLSGDTHSGGLGIERGLGGSYWTGGQRRSFELFQCQPLLIQLYFFQSVGIRELGRGHECLS